MSYYGVSNEMTISNITLKKITLSYFQTKQFKSPSFTNHVYTSIKRFNLEKTVLLSSKARHTCIAFIFKASYMDSVLEG